jgi:peroxiredoxin family protein
MAEKKKFSIIVFSGDYDKAFAAFTIASGAAALEPVEGEVHRILIRGA